MRKIPYQLYFDFMLVALGHLLCLLVLTPFNMKLSNYVSPVLHIGIESVLVYVSILISEILVAYPLKKPLKYEDAFPQNLLHLVLVYIFSVLIYSAFSVMYHVISNFGIQHIEYAWIDYDGNFTLRWYLRKLGYAVTLGLFLALFVVLITRFRAQRLEINTLREINEALEFRNQKLIFDEASDNMSITIQGDGKDSITLNPNDMLYVESIANYLCIVYFADKQITQKRLRGSLKNIEAKLDKYNFLIHTHRAFLVNVNYITQIEGNSSGYKISLFGLDRKIPVSKSNVEFFKKRVK